MGLTELIEKVKQNDQQAFEDLYNQYYQMGFSLALQFVKNEEEAMDIMQEVFITVYSKLELLEDATKFKSWYMQIVANKCRDFLKKQKPLSFTDANAYDEDGALQFEIEETDRDFIPEQAVDYSETVRVVDEMLAQLPEEQRMCLLLYFANDMKISEIADALQVSEATVKSRLKYGKDKIREKAEAYQKKTGTKLYSITALTIIPFIRWMLNNKQFFTPSAPQKAFGAIWEATAGGNLASNAATVLGQSSGVAANLQNTSGALNKIANLKNIVVNNFSTLTNTQKIIGGIAAGAIVLGTSAGVATTMASPKKPAATPPTTIATTVPETTAPLKIKLKLDNYLTIEYSGVDGKATATLNVDYDKLESALGKDEIKNYLLQTLGNAQNADLQHLLAFSLSSQEALTNGDVLTVNIAPAKALQDRGIALNDIEEYFGVTFDTSLTFAVADLKDHETLDVIEIVKNNLIYEGANGSAYARLTFADGHQEIISEQLYLEFTKTSVTFYVNQEAIGSCDISLLVPSSTDSDFYDENGPLANGDELLIVLTLENMASIDDALKKVDYVLETTEDSLIVSGL